MFWLPAEISLTPLLASPQSKVALNTALGLAGITTDLSLHSALAWMQSREEVRSSRASVTGFRRTNKHVVLPPDVLVWLRTVSVCSVRRSWPCSWRFPSWRRTCGRVWSSCPTWLKRWIISRPNTGRMEKSAGPLSGPGNTTDQLRAGGRKFTVDHCYVTTGDVASWLFSLLASWHVCNIYSCRELVTIWNTLCTKLLF